ncbi:hypothetical protein [uncultured Algibacter sp.]|uniref:hypothetical protein n=1 Tax=uncultured Algibacter sp. TaxID=298659 RepID=UPI0026099C0A|nr:hypothetical protein [uncultured Algibacter sp.]
MKHKYKILLLGFFAVILVDSIGSVASKVLNFDYGNLTPLSMIIYTAIGFFSAKHGGLKSSLIFSGLVGFFDSTIGWKISLLLNANTGEVQNLEITPLIWLITSLFMILYSAFFGLIGYGITRFLNIKTRNM